MSTSFSIEKNCVFTAEHFGVVFFFCSPESFFSQFQQFRFRRLKVFLVNFFFSNANMCHCNQQGSRIKDQGLNGQRKRVRLEKRSPFSAYSRPKRQQTVEYQRKYCKKMQTEREKQKSSTSTGDPLQRVGSELKKRKPG